jgi:hypothetical protein
MSFTRIYTKRLDELHPNLHKDIDIYTHIHAHIHTHIHIHIHTYIHVPILFRLYRSGNCYRSELGYTGKYIHTHAHMDIHTYIYLFYSGYLGPGIGIVMGWASPGSVT